MLSTDQIKNIQDGKALDSDGDKIGSIGQIYLDDRSGEPAWATVNTGLFGNSESFIPLHDAQVEGNDVKFPYTKDKVKDAPRVDADQHLDVEQEQELYRYYGVADGSADTTRGGYDTSDHDHDPDHDHAVTDRDATDRGTADGDNTITRSEEQLHVGTETRETGRARLRKYIVTEDVTTTVPVSHEEVRVVREPITAADRGDALSGGDLTEEEHEVTLHAEQPVVQKETVPVERVKLDTETVTGEQEVTEQVRKEQIETDAAEREHGTDNR